MLQIIKNFFVVTWERIKGDTPRYWRRLSMIGLIMTGAAAFLTENESIIPEKYKFITKYAVAFSAGITLVTRLATTNTELATKSDELLLKENKDKTIDTI